MAPATPQTLAQFALDDALESFRTLQAANQQVIMTLHETHIALNFAEELNDPNMDETVRTDAVWSAYAAYIDARTVYEDVMGGAIDDVKAAEAHLASLQV